MELKAYWPDFLAALTEFGALAEAEQPEMTAAIAAVRAAPEDFFVETLTETGVRRWERLLALPGMETGDLADRRFRILSRSVEQRPFTEGKLRELLETLCGPGGFSVAVSCPDFTLTVRVALTAKKQYDGVATLLERIVPLNMTVDLSLLYNQHRLLAGFTHSRLGAHTHGELRNEVLTNGD